MNTLVCLTLVLVFAFINANCGAGYYKSSNIERPCLLCSSGNYCPGDDEQYPCSPGYVQPQLGRASCDQCPSKRSESYRLVCLAENTPLDAQEIKERDVVVSTGKPFWYGLVSFATFGGYKGHMSQYTFYDPQQFGKQQLAVYASTKSGKPTKNDHEFHAMGENATVAIEGDSKFYRMVYFNIVPISEDKTTARIGNWVYMNKEYDIVDKSTTIKTVSDFAQWPDVGGLFKVKVPAKSSVTVSVSLEDYERPYDGTHFTLYASSLPTIEYPNMYNADIVSNSNKGKRAVGKISGKSNDDGQFAFQLITPTAWRSLIVVNTTVSL